MLQFENKMADLLNQTFLATANQNNLVNLAKQIGYPMPTYMFKWTHSDGKCHGGTSAFQYSLPTPEAPGEWHSKTKSKKPIVACSNGFHCTSLSNVDHFSGSYGPRLFLVEVSGKFDLDTNWDYYTCRYMINKAAVENIRLVYEFKNPPISEGDISKWLLENFEFPVGTLESFITCEEFDSDKMKVKRFDRNKIGNLIGTLHLDSDGTLI